MAESASRGVIDTHAHVWQRGRFDYAWIAPGSALDRDFLPGDLQSAIHGSDVVGGLLVEAAGTIAEIPWLLECATSLPGDWGVVGSIELEKPESVEQIRRFSKDRRFKGVRLNWLDEKTETHRFHKVYAVLHELRLSVDILTQPAHLPQIARFVRQHPGVTFVIDHMGGIALTRDAAHKAVAQLAPFSSLDNVAVKVSGYPPGLPILRGFLDALDGLFGADRLCFGSNYPLCLDQFTYLTVATHLQQGVAHKPLPWRDALFYETARRLYHLDAPTTSEQARS
jgi:L-fuconolactonase